MNSNESGKMIKYSAGSILLNEGEQSSTLFKIIHGHVELYIGYGTKNEVLLGIIGPQKCFGEFGLFSDRPALYTAVAYSDVVVMSVGRDEVADFIRGNSRSAINIMKNMAHMIMIMQQQISLLSGEIDRNPPADAGIVHHDMKQVRTITRKDLIRRYAIHAANVDMTGLYDAML